MFKKIMTAIIYVLTEFIPFATNEWKELKGKKWWEIIIWIICQFLPFVSKTLYPNIKNIFKK